MLRITYQNTEELRTRVGRCSMRVLSWSSVVNDSKHRAGKCYVWPS